MNRFFVFMFATVVFSAGLLALPVRAATEGCFCTRYDYVNKKDGEEKPVPAATKASECNGSRLRVERNLSAECKDDAQFTGCKFDAKTETCTCKNTKTGKMSYRITPCLGDNKQYRTCEAKENKCLCEETRTKCRWVSGASTDIEALADVAALRDKAKGLNRFKRFASVPDFIGQVIKIMLSFIGSILLALYVYAGVLWMTAGGNSEKVDQSKNILIWSTLGVSVMLASYIIINYVFRTILAK